VAHLRVTSGRARTIAVAAPSVDSTRSVLIVDDEPGVRHLMRRWLVSRGYVVSVASGADQALERLAATPTAVALCDLRMPGHDGLWLADQLRRQHPDTAVIIATGLNDVGAAVESLRQGVIDYLTKPFERDRLCEAVSRAVEWHRSACDSRRWRERLEDEMQARRAHLEDIIASQFVDSDDDLDVLLATLTATNPEAYAHAYRVAALSATVGRALQLPDAERVTLERAALLHDLGKLAMPEAVLRKPAPLTVEEQRLIRLHPRIGCELIAHVPYLVSAATVVRDAYERVDGLGYPTGSRGDEVGLPARIVAVADAYDTMTRARVFRDAISPAAALAELERCRGTQFDIRAVDAFVAVTAGGAVVDRV
jgi:response regulator RpfG family c-di-GMP phosphodiesterase